TQIDDELELGRLLDGEVGGLCAPQNLVHILGGTPKQVGEVRSVGDQTARFDVFREIGHRRQPQAERQDDDAYPVSVYERIATDVKGVRAALERLKDGRNVLRSPNFECGDLVAKTSGRCLNLAHFQHGVPGFGIGQDRQAAKTGDNLAQEFEALVRKIDLLD